MGFAALIITVGAVVSLMLLVVVMPSGDVMLACLDSDLFNLERCILCKDCWIYWCARCASSYGGWWFFLKLSALSVTNELLLVIIILVRARMVMAGDFAAASVEIVFTIFM